MALPGKDFTMRWTWMAVLALAAGCNGIELDKLVDTPAARTRFAPEPPGSHCAHGGQQVQSGLDRNGNGALDDAEVTSTEYACAPAAPASLVRSEAEPPGANCERGGQAVRTGPDLDADGQLDEGEVTGTEYVCATAIPDVLLRTRLVPPGERCPYGGQVSHAGRDVDGDGLLGDTEITREVYGCMEPEPVLTRVRLLERAPFVCQFSSSIVEAGADLDRDGVFDDAELRASVRICAATSVARVRQRPEPAGSHCAAGGTAVEAGKDVNADGVLADDEVLGTTYVCQNAPVFDGTFEVRDAADLAALGTLSHIRGGLIIWRTALTEVVLPGLSGVEGSVEIDGNAALARLELPGLRFVRDALVLNNNASLETLAIGPPGPLHEPPVWVGSHVTLDSSPLLTTLSGLAAVSPRQGLGLFNLPGLVEPGTLPYLQQPTGDVTVWGNANLRRLPFVNLSSVGGTFQLFGNPALESLEGANILGSVGGDFIVQDNDSLPNLWELWSLRTIGGGLVVRSNDSLQSGGLGPLLRVGSITLSGNAALESVSSMGSLKSVDGDITITDNPKLVEVADFPVLQTVGGSLTLTGNALLTTLTGLERVPRLQSLSVARNGALTSLGGLSGLHDVEELWVQENAELARLELGGLQRVGTRFVVTDNAKLPECLASSLATDVYAGPPGDRVIARNDSTTPCGQ